MSTLIYGDEAYRIIGACFEVYSEKGCGFLEAVYQECLEIELRLKVIPFRARTPLALTYKGRLLTQRYVADLVCFDNVVVELKAMSALMDAVRAQALH